MHVLTQWLSDVSPDVLSLQETKVINDQFPRAEFENAGYTSVFMGEKSYNGVAILSKKKLSDVCYGFDGEGKDEGTRLIAVKIGKLNIVNTYVPQGVSPDSDKFRYKLEWFRRIKSFFNERYKPDEPVLWLGDFNVARSRLMLQRKKCSQWDILMNTGNWF
jgi:exodeoxyribonuclease-3